MRANRGISLIEVLIVVAIIGILIQLILPAVQASREAARRTQCSSNIRQMGIAIQAIHGTHKKLPQAAGYFPMEDGPFQSDKRNAPLWDPDNKETILSRKAPANFSTAMYFLLPYMEEQAKYMQFWGTTQGNGPIPDPPFDKDGQWSDRAQAPRVQLCPSDTACKYKGIITWKDRKLGISNYPVNIQALGHYNAEQPTPTKKRRLPQDFSDGSSKTVVFAERYAICKSIEAGRNAWLGTFVTPGVAPYDPFFGVNNKDGSPNIPMFQDAPEMEKCNPKLLQGNHPGIMTIVLADGSTRGISPNINEETWRYLVIPNDGKTLSENW
jgi:prepilin-type N-terminal cleavage/methylation domain-containing protein